MHEFTVTDSYVIMTVGILTGKIMLPNPLLVKTYVTPTKRRIPSNMEAEQGGRPNCTLLIKSLSILMLYRHAVCKGDVAPSLLNTDVL